MKAVFFCLIMIISLMYTGCLLDKKNDTGKKKKIKSDVYTMFDVGIVGFSGICPGKIKETFLAVSDKKGIFVVSKEGKIIQKLPLIGSNDFEGITINPLSNEVFLADEGQMKVFKLSKDEQSLELILNVNVFGDSFNKGIEGITFGNDTLYIVNQESPALLIKYDLQSKKEVDRLSLNYVKHLSDISYDDFDKTLWILDSNKKKIFHTDLNGNVIASLSIPYIKKAEAITVERAAKVAWIGCDDTGFLYKVELKI